MRLGVVTDIHVCPAGTPPDAWHNPYDSERAVWRLGLALDRLASEGVESIAVLGDLTSLADAGSVERCLATLSACPLPLRIVPGNHDAEPSGVNLADSIAAIGQPAIRLAVPSSELLGGVRVAGVDIGQDPTNDRWLVGAIEADGWGDEPVLLMSHSPLINRESEIEAAGLRNAGTFDDPSDVAGTLARLPGPTVVLHGHFHVRDAVASHPVLQLGFAALIEPPNEVGLVEISSDDGALDLQVTRLPIEPVPAARLPVLVPERQRWRFVAGRWNEIDPS